MKPIFIYPPTVDWDHLHQRPQQLLKALTRQGCISVFCNTNIMGKRPAGIQFIHENLIVASNIDFYEVVRDMRSNYPGHPIIVYYSYPGQVHMIHQAGADLIIFDSLDEPVNEFAHWLPDYEYAVRSADLVIASAKSLQQRAQAYRSDEVVLVPNGCDYEHFAKAQNLSSPTFKTEGKQVVGFVGAVATWLDWELIRKIAELPLVELVFIGPLYGLTSPPVQASNVKYIGHVPYEELPKHMAEFDVFIIPFLLNDMTKGVSPIKFWEYLATGKPIVSTALPEVVNSAQATIIDHENYAYAVIHDSLDDRLRRIEYAKANSWDERAKRIVSQLEGIIWRITS
ncbi:glycosyl transferase family 1 [Collibacillus ludicampi]|uniref:Glycosyl transferase family 1 n=1 Tax=Collibacillus ludicampi TaxID=2771369 RepID=A0AAV4LH37_9BACL|nr:glycosyltransferase [Collibacillus ludicampi]GIM47028.1 glycosyl transferase family 1 [Collibacillus ludicampi]